MAPVPQNTSEDARRLLANCILFRGLVTGERDAVVARARIRHFAAGETIFLMGSPGTSMMAVLRGTVRISVPSPEGREIVLAILQPGEVFGEIALLDGKERTADARAMTGCDLAVLERRGIPRAPAQCLAQAGRSALWSAACDRPAYGRSRHAAVAGAACQGAAPHGAFRDARAAW
jgi:hypothetical protein